jgi:hypothetical protein
MVATWLNGCAEMCEITSAGYSTIKLHACYQPHTKGDHNMYFHVPRNLCSNTSSVAALITATLLIVPFQSSAAGSSNTKIPNYEEYKQYHVHYDVNADGTYTETDELAKAVNTDQDVSMSRMFQVGFQWYGIDGGKDKDINILSAYTLKKNGEHVDAILPTIPQWAVGLAPSPPNRPVGIGSSPMGAPQKPRKLIAFQNVEIGDTLVYSYKAVPNEPASPNNIVIVQSFPKVVAYDDAEISVSAPASMALRVDTVAIGKAEKVVEGNIQKMVWKYQNQTPDELPDPTHPVRYGGSDPRIHISSFADAATEGFTRYTQMNKGCNAMWRIAHDGPEAIDTSSSWISNAFLHNEKYLAYAVNELKNPECVFEDGRPMLVALSGGYDIAFKGQPDWSESLSRVEYFKQKYPGQAFVALAEAIYWKDYAWDARGEGFASSVTPDGWRLFKERLEKAETVLNDTKSYSAELPVWYDEMILVQSALERPEDERDKIFLEGTRKFKTYYPIYFTMLNFLSPKWGGTWATVDNMIKWSVDNTKEIDGTSMYARLYWAAYGNAPDGTNFLKDTLVSWPKMKQGFEDLMSRHPNSKWNLNNFAKFACMANDKDTFLALRNKIGKDVVDAAWPQNTSLDLCETKFGYEQ